MLTEDLTAPPAPLPPRRGPTGGGGGSRALRRAAPALGALIAVVTVVAVVLWQMHLSLLLTNSTTTGGDTGAHFMMPPYLQGLLSHGHLTGWDPDWYDGYPIYTFYFTIPDVLAALFGWVIPYGIAFKLATVLGSVTMPLCAWACGRLLRLRPPLPAAMAAATLPFLFEGSFTIYGGNLFSTLAGEYAYSLSISLALLFLGLVGAGLRTGRYRGWAAITLACCILAHIVPAFFAIAGAVLLTLFDLVPRRFFGDDRPTHLGSERHLRAAHAEPSRWRRLLDPPPGTAWGSLWWTGSTILLGLCLSAWWLAPFGLELPYANSMGYQNITTYVHLLFPSADLWAMVLAGASLLLALVRRSRAGLLLAALAGLGALAVVVDPQGNLYNARFLPMWFLFVYLLVGWGFATGCFLVARWLRRAKMRYFVHRLGWSLADGEEPPRRPAPPRWAPGALGGALLATLAAVVVVVPPFVFPASDLPVTVGANQVSSWAEWNYTGYEGKPAYPEYRGLIETMARLGRTHGCGRAMWEYNSNLDRFGTPMALMLLPYWTGGCVDSMEGLLFESSATTPYHFLNQAELSASPSEPMVGLPYGPVDVALGVEHLQLLGVRYFMASSPEVEAQAAADPALHLVATSGPWHSAYGDTTVTTTWDIYQVADSGLVSALSYRPAVVSHLGQSQSKWLPTSVAWYQHPDRWSVELSGSGPSSWPRVRKGDPSPPRVAVPRTTVSKVATTNDTVSFHVSRTGTPVLVKVSYFPNWQVSGASGPYRVTPNLMVVVPKSHTVTLTYGTTKADDLGTAATGAGAVVLVAMVVLFFLRRRQPRGRGAAG